MLFQLFKVHFQFLKFGPFTILQQGEAGFMTCTAGEASMLSIFETANVPTH